MLLVAKALDVRGLPLRIEPGNKRRTYLTIQGQVIAIRLMENTARTEREPTEQERQEIKKRGYTYLPDRYSYHHTGMLKLGILSGYRDKLQKVVADGKQQRIEQYLNEFVVKIETEAVRRKREAEHHARQRLRWEEEARVRREYEEKQRKEMERFKALEEEASNWKRAEDLRAYISAVEAKAAREEGSDSRAELPHIRDVKAPFTRHGSSLFQRRASTPYAKPCRSPGPLSGRADLRGRT